MAVYNERRLHSLLGYVAPKDVLERRQSAIHAVRDRMSSNRQVPKGIWTGLIPGRAGRLDEVTFQFAQKGTKLEGKLYGDYRSSPIVEGTVKGTEVEFVVVAEEQAGNQINEVRMRFTGRLEGGALELTRERGAATNAGNAGGVQSRDGATLTFCLKRLL